MARTSTPADPTLQQITLSIFAWIRRRPALTWALFINMSNASYTFAIFYGLPCGARVRPMGWAVAEAGIAVVSFVIGTLLTLVDMWRETKLALLVWTLSLAPLPLALAIFRMFIAVKGLRVEP